MLPCFQIDKKLLPMKMHYFFGIAGTSPVTPFLSTISKQRGYSPVIVGLIFTILPIPGLLCRPIVGAVTDKYKCRKMALILNTVMIGAMVCVLVTIPGANVKRELDDMDVVRSPSFWLFTVTVIAFNTGGMVRTVLEDTICFGLLGEDKHQYGQQRMWGAVGWGLMSVVSGACVDWFSDGLDYKNYPVGFVIGLICLVIDVLVSCKIEVVQNEDNKSIGSDVKNVFTKIKVQAFILWTMLFGFFCAMIWYFMFWYMEDLSDFYHPETKPYIKTLQGLSLTIQCFGGEVPMFMLSSYVIKRMGHMNVYSLTFFTFGTRFFLYSIIRNPIFVLPVELLNGVTFALAYSAAMSYAAHIAPVGTEGTIQGLVGACINGIGSGVGSLAGGYLFNKFGSITSFAILSGVAFAVCVTQIFVNRLINRSTEPNEHVPTCSVEPKSSDDRM